MDWRLPIPRLETLAVWQRNALVWRRMIGASVLMHFGEPFILLIGLGYGLGRFIGEMAGIPYFAFLASGFIAWSAMNVASMEAMWSVYTRMVPQQTYEAILATPTRVDDIVIGELLWYRACAQISPTWLTRMSLADRFLSAGVKSPSAIPTAGSGRFVPPWRPNRTARVSSAAQIRRSREEKVRSAKGLGSGFLGLVVLV